MTKRSQVQIPALTLCCVLEEDILSTVLSTVSSLEKTPTWSKLFAKVAPIKERVLLQLKPMYRIHHINRDLDVQ